MRALTGLLALLLLLPLAACGVLSLSEEERTELAQEDEAGQSMGQALAATYAADHIFSLNYDAGESFNPFTTTSAWNTVVGQLVYEPLVWQDKSFEAQPNLITAWSSEDGMNWTFTVDTGRGFHDGGVMTAADAAYSVQQACNYGSPYNRRFRHVQGVASTSGDTFVVILDEPNWRFYELMNIPCIEASSGYESMPPGTGPYQFSQSGRYLTVYRDHPDAAQMPLDTIHLKEYTNPVDILQAFEDSYLDLVINDPNSMASLGYSSTNLIKYIDTTSLHYIGYNTRGQLFGQSMYRAVVTYAVDRASIVSDIMKGAGAAATLPVHPSSGLYPEAYAKTLAYSDEALDIALMNIGAQDLDGDGYLEFGGQKYTVNFIVCSESGVKVSIARLIAHRLRDAGIDVNLRELDYDDYTQAIDDGNYDMYYAEVRLCGDWDLSLLLASGGSLNFGGVRDGSLDTLLSQFLRAQDEERSAAAEELYEYIGQNAPITAVCFEKREVLYHRGVLQGLEPTQDTVFYNMRNWTVDLG